MDKPYTTYDEQLKILTDKHLVIKDKEEVVKLLKKCSYFGLVTGYKHPFKDKEGFYKIHTTINDIYALYSYDMELRELFLKYILIVENHIKSLISYCFCDSFGEEESAYLNANNYDYNQSKQDEINYLIGKLKKEMNNYDSHPYLQHQKNHGNIPLWVLVKVLTLGVISNMYRLLKPQTQTMVCKEFKYISEEDLAQMIEMLSKFRNVSAHNERLYDYKYIRIKDGKMLSTEIRTTDVHKVLKLKTQKGSYVQGKNDLFSVVIIFKYLLSDEELSSFIESFDSVTNKLLSKTNIIQKSQILKLMGFPNNWQEIKNCPKHINKEE